MVQVPDELEEYHQMSWKSGPGQLREPQCGTRKFTINTENKVGDRVAGELESTVAVSLDCLLCQWHALSAVSAKSGTTAMAAMRVRLWRFHAGTYFTVSASRCERPHEPLAQIRVVRLSRVVDRYLATGCV